MVSGFITSIQGCIVSGKHEKDGTANSAHRLGYKAGLAE